MLRGRSCIDQALPAAAALARGRVVAEQVDAACPVAFYGAPLQLAAVVLGAFQHAPHALRQDALSSLALPVIRRRTGGASVWGGEGLLYCALGLLDASALMPCPAGKLLNRNVRGLLVGARALGVPTNYFGRDFLSFGVEPGIYVSFAEAADGRVVLEAFVGLDAPFPLPAQLIGYPEPSAPAFRGKTPTTLRRAGLAAAASAREVLEALRDGYARLNEVSFDADALTADECARAESLRVELASPPVDSDLRWSAPREEAIGFVAAGARLAADGSIADVALSGDFMQRDACAAELQRALLGKPPTPEVIGAALDTVYGRHPGALEGVRSLTTLRDALIDACAPA